MQVRARRPSSRRPSFPSTSRAIYIIPSFPTDEKFRRPRNGVHYDVLRRRHRSRRSGDELGRKMAADMYDLLTLIIVFSANFFRVAKYVRGMYAIRVRGRIPEDVEHELENRGIRYRPRDQMDQD